MRAELRSALFQLGITGIRRGTQGPGNVWGGWGGGDSKTKREKMCGIPGHCPGRIAQSGTDGRGLGGGGGGGSKGHASDMEVSAKLQAFARLTIIHLMPL